MTTLDSEKLNFEEKELYIPSIVEISEILRSGLIKNFTNVTVDYIDCPDLTEEPFHLADRGLNGTPTLIEIGGPPYLLPLVDRTKLYDLKKICDKVFSGSDNNTIKKYLAVGAGAGPWPLVNTNCEGIFNLGVANGIVKNESHLAIVDAEKKCHLEKIPDSETSLALLGNIYLSEGKPGKVLSIKCSQRIGDDDFIASIRKTLAEHYVDKTVGLGGVFLLKKGSAKQHVMQDFSKTPINNEDELNSWLKFYNMNATLIAVGTLITDEADLDLRLQHFHSFSTHGVGGHYHIDVTPDIVEYEGLFCIGEKIVRIDRPLETHKFGRD